jgi:tetratricopeptide (TPR) repeat protein
VAAEWATSHRTELSALETAFMSASQEHERQQQADKAEQNRLLAEAERQRAEEAEQRVAQHVVNNRRLRNRAVVMALLFLVATVAAIVAVWEQRNARAYSRTQDEIVRLLRESQGDRLTYDRLLENERIDREKVGSKPLFAPLRDTSNAANQFVVEGTARLQMKQHDRAIASYTKAIDIDPQNIAAYLMRGRAWLEKKEYDRAIADFSEAIGIDQSSTMAYHYRSLAYNGKAEAYRKALTNSAETSANRILEEISRLLSQRR